MIPYNSDPKETIPANTVKIIGLGGAGTNMLEHVALDGMEGAECLALNTDIRTLANCLAQEKIQLGLNLTKGLGTGGDPDLGHQAALEAEDVMRAALRGRRIVFLCVGLGGGTGSGAAPIITRIAREEGAFVVVFATMPFAFEGKRRRDQAETSLNELAVLSNVLVTFDNNRIGELVLAKQGIHEAFIAADIMICEAMKAVIRLVIRPGLINIGLDDLMSALRTNRSRCLFGSGIARGKDRAICALRNALASPLLDQGSLLKEAQTVLVHLCGGEDLTLFEIELLMQRLQTFVPEHTHVLFGAAVDPAMGDALSLTLISALPEDSLAMASRASMSHPPSDPSPDATAPLPQQAIPSSAPAELPKYVLSPAPEPARNPEPEAVHAIKFAALPEIVLPPESSSTPESAPPSEPPAPAAQPAPSIEPVTAGARPAVEIATFTIVEPKTEKNPDLDVPDMPDIPEWQEPSDTAPILGGDFSGVPAIPKRRPQGVTPWSPIQGPKSLAADLETSELDTFTPPAASESPHLDPDIKSATPPSELPVSGNSRGRFEDENPNDFDGADLDLPPFMRKKSNPA